MNGRISALALCLVTAASGAAHSEEVISERGAAVEAASPAPPKHAIEIVPGGIERTFTGQPPMIPHPIDKYEISLRINGCLKCHSDATYETEKAKRTPDSHYLDRDGNKLESISSRRYFCTQCHAVQLSGDPLVGNTFQGR